MQKVVLNDTGLERARRIRSLFRLNADIFDFMNKKTIMSLALCSEREREDLLRGGKRDELT
jgi:hypothetical protein